MKRLKIILESKYFIYLIIIISIIYTFVSICIFNSSEVVFKSTYTGIVRDLKIYENKVTFVLSEKFPVLCIIYTEEKNQDYISLLGKRIKVIGKNELIYNNTIPNTFNYKKYLYSKGIKHKLIIDNYEIIKKENYLYKIKQSIIYRINNYNENIGKYLQVFILNNKNDLDEITFNIYKNNGVLHLFSVSGLHFSFLIYLLSVFLKKANKSNILLLICIYLYAFIVGFTASVMRTLIFITLKTLLKKYNIVLSNTRVLLLTAFIIILLNPLIIYDIGFQYSFVITFAIFQYSKKINGSILKKTLLISLIAQLYSLPITINMNYEINATSFLINLIYVPYITYIVFPLAILTFIAPFLAIFFGLALHILDYINHMSSYTQILIIVPYMKFYLVILYYFIAFYISLKYSVLKKLSVLICFIIFNIFINYYFSDYVVNYFDVGQGDSSIIITKNNNNIIMIDTGGVINSSYNVSNNIIVYLKSRGISKINYLILTHGDYDHMGEAINLVENFKVEKVIFNCGEFNNLEQELIKVLDKKKIKYYSCIKELNIDNNKLYFLLTKEYDNENDNSNVIYTELNGYKFMFMGDAGVTTENEILDKYNLPDIDVLKVGHHGSRTSSSKEFIDMINPKYSVISVGKKNRYGHPNKEVLEILKGSKIYRTDEDGSIMFKIKNNKLKIETCSP